ncbi:hypothetical protein BLA29_011742 [Euroglyphus maynei]|uniref:Uncharacterized protein n=1 Tax=Euroglyphus maynei TaxID=6958 RepID=A0A1Y3ARW6_EURMA|nr:hypothetical protein BLA29_011742 [Euroglyphus maynei]
MAPFSAEKCIITRVCKPDERDVIAGESSWFGKMFIVLTDVDTVRIEITRVIIATQFRDDRCDAFMNVFERPLFVLEKGMCLHFGHSIATQPIKAVSKKGTDETSSFN